MSFHEPPIVSNDILIAKFFALVDEGAMIMSFRDMVNDFQTIVFLLYFGSVELVGSLVPVICESLNSLA